MATASILKHSFSGGEWSPSLYARTDLAKYQTANRLMKNFIVHPHGGASNRGGTRFVGEAKDSSAVTRLVAFQFSVVQSYILEFGNLYMRVYKDSARVVEADSTISGATQADPVVITDNGHGYSNGNWVVISDIVGMTELNGKTFRVNSVLTNTYELQDVDGSDIDGTGYAAYASGGISAKVYELETAYPTADLPLLKFVQSADVLYVTHPSYPPGKISRTGHTAWTIANVVFEAGISAPENLAGGGTGENYKVTAIAEGGEESLPSAPVDSAPANNLTWDAVSGAEYYNVYKETNSSGAYFWIGQAAAETFTEPAATIDPDLTKSPPTAKNPFNGADNYPGSAMFFQQRLLFARTNNSPQTVWGSVTGSFENMNVSSPIRDDDSYNFTINARQVNEIKWMVPVNELIMGTSGAEWKLASGRNSDSVTPSSVSILAQSYWGVSDVVPIVIGNNVVFIEGSGDKIRDMAYSFEVDSYSGNDLTILSSHLFEDKTVDSWSYQQDPDSVIWCVRSDGVLLSLTYEKSHQVFAWCQHETDGKFESTASITSGAGISETWVIVNRTIGGVTRRYVERFVPRLPNADIKDAFFVDCGLSYDNPLDIIGAAQADPIVIESTGHGYSNGNLVDIVDVLGMVEINNTRFKIANVTADTLELQDIEGNDIDGTGYTAYTSGGEVRKAVTTISGLHHLEGKTASILGDGSVFTPRVVNGGSVTINHASSRIHIGLGYSSDLQTLDFDYPTKTSQTVQDKKRAVKSVMLRLRNTRGLFVGPDSNNLDEIPFRESEALGDPIALYTGDKEVPLPPGESQNESRVYIKNADPIPLTVLSIIARVEHGED